MPEYKSYNDFVVAIETELDWIDSPRSIIISAKQLSNNNFSEWLMQKIGWNEITIYTLESEYQTTFEAFNIIEKLVKTGFNINIVDTLKEEFILIDNNRLLTGDLKYIFTKQKNNIAYTYDIIEGEVSDITELIHSLIGTKKIIPYSEAKKNKKRYDETIEDIFNLKEPPFLSANPFSRVLDNLVIESKNKKVSETKLLKTVATKNKPNNNSTWRLVLALFIVFLLICILFFIIDTIWQNTPRFIKGFISFIISGIVLAFFLNSNKN